MVCPIWLFSTMTIHIFRIIIIIISISISIISIIVINLLVLFGIWYLIRLVLSVLFIWLMLVYY
jgi:hypothetical protein